MHKVYFYNEKHSYINTDLCRKGSLKKKLSFLVDMSSKGGGGNYWKYGLWGGSKQKVLGMDSYLVNKCIYKKKKKFNFLLRPGGLNAQLNMFAKNVSFLDGNPFFKGLVICCQKSFYASEQVSQNNNKPNQINIK